MSNLGLLRSLVRPFTPEELDKIAAYEKEVEDNKAAIKKMTEEYEEFCRNAPVKNPINFVSSPEEIIAYLVSERQGKLYEDERCRRWRALKDSAKALEYPSPPFPYHHRVKLLASLSDDKELECLIRLEGNYFSITYQTLGTIENRCFGSVHLPGSHTHYYDNSIDCWPVKGGHAIKGVKLDIVKIKK